MKRLDEISRLGLRDAHTILQQHGYHQLGKGTFATIWAKSGANTVLKVFKASDKAYLAFANFAVQHRNNPHFPRLYGKIIRINDDWRAVRMERLQPVSGDQKTNATGLELYMDYYGDMQRVAYRLREHPHLVTRLEELFKAEPTLKQACDLVIDTFYGRHRMDLHDENIMQRGATIVITDPVCY